MTFKMLSFNIYAIIVLFLLVNDDRQCVTARYLPTRGHTDNMDRLRELIQDILNSDPYAGLSIVTTPLHENSNNNNNNNNNPDNYGRIRNVDRDNTYDTDYVNNRKHNVNADNLDFVLNKGRNNVGAAGNLKTNFNNPLISEDLDGYQRFLFKRAAAAVDDVDAHINKLNDNYKFKMNIQQPLEALATIDHRRKQNDDGRQFMADKINNNNNNNNNNINNVDDENLKHQRQLLKLHKHKN